jgi:uncharacterized protein YhaN
LLSKIKTNATAQKNRKQFISKEGIKKTLEECKKRYPLSKKRRERVLRTDFFAAFGYDGVGQIGSETTINSGDLAGILMIAVQALEKRTAELKQKEAQIAVLESRLEALESRTNQPIQITAAESLSDNLWQK